MFTFDPLTEGHLDTFRNWLRQDHVKRFWQEPEDPVEFREKFLSKLSTRGVRSFIFSKDQTPVGYIQYYEASKIGGGWWESEPPGTYGIDLLIGSADHLGSRLGSVVIKEFIDFLRAEEDDVASVIIDPDPGNSRAIRSFEKAGFAREKEIVTPNGPALLMRLRI